MSDKNDHPQPNKLDKIARRSRSYPCVSVELNCSLRWIQYWLKKTQGDGAWRNREVRQLCYDILNDLEKHGVIDSFNMETGVIMI